MPRHGFTRHGSLQFYPRVRAKKRLPRVSWEVVPAQKGLQGFIGYKVGMASAYVRDTKPSSLTKGQRITVPVTILAFPSMKILSVRFYHHHLLVGEVMNATVDKEVKKRMKVQKTAQKKLEDFKKAYDDIRVLVYAQTKKTGIKKMPDLAELGIAGTVEEKLGFVSEVFHKELHIKDFLKAGMLVDVRGVTKGKGLQGPTKRFGLNLNFHKKEKGVRGPGSGGPWHPARVEFTQPMAGQMGYFTRVVYNNKILTVMSLDESDINPSSGFKHFGKIKTDYALICGSVQGPVKRELLVTPSLRPSRRQSNKQMEFIEVR